MADRCRWIGQRAAGSPSAALFVVMIREVFATMLPDFYLANAETSSTGTQTDTVQAPHPY